MKRTIQAIRGMSDILPDEMPYWSHLEQACRSLVSSYGYREIRFPILEETALFKRTIGESTDIIEKEMYSFVDRNGDSLSLRPEGTAGCVRAGIQHSLFYNQTPRLWYMGPMFRHERPQKGRYRQFYQWGVEAYGMADVLIEVELILIGARLWKSLSLSEYISLELNTLGTRESRVQYREKLVDYLNSRINDLDEDSQRRLKTNPLRILDSKNPATQAVLSEAPRLHAYLDDESRRRFDQLQATLERMAVPYKINPFLVRGLDYYSQTVFEWTTDCLGSQGTVCAGGRYDQLVEQLGGKSIPAVGFAAGLERLVLLLQLVCKRAAKTDIYVIAATEYVDYALSLAERFRDEFPTWSIETHLSGGSFKSQFRRADKSGARWAVIVGDEEIKTGKLQLKFLREKTEQMPLSEQEIVTYLRERKHQND